MLCVVFSLAAEARSECVRWWMSPSVAADVGITPNQAATIEGLYEHDLAARREASQNVMRLTASVGDYLNAGFYDDMRPLTERLAAADRRQCELRRRLLELSGAPLTAAQRARLRALIAAHRLLD